MRRALGAGALLLAFAALAWPVVRSSRSRPRAVHEAAAVPEVAEPEKLALAKTSVKALEAASDALKGAATQALASRSAGLGAPPTAAPPTPAPSAAAPPPPEVVETDEATQCMEALVPELTFGPGRLDWVCGQPDLWQLHLDLYGRAVGRGSGRGVALWMQLGRFELGAIAILRATCCPGATPLTAEVATQHCGSLSEASIALGADPSTEHIERYDQTMQCLVDRKVRLPEAWQPIGYEQSKRFFDEFLAGARTGTGRQPR